MQKTYKQEASLNSLCVNCNKTLKQFVSRPAKPFCNLHKNLVLTTTLIFHRDAREDDLVYPLQPDTLTTVISRQFSPAVRCQQELVVERVLVTRTIEMTFQVISCKLALRSTKLTISV